MQTPFPGMDPYLERPNLWMNVHNSLIIALRDYLVPLLRPRYFVSVEERSYLDDPLAVGFTSVPDVGVVGPFTQRPIQQVAPRLVTDAPFSIELPMPERVRETYLEVQAIGAEIGAEIGHAVEIDGSIPKVRVVTLLEILSPWNKLSQEGRFQYQQKRRQILNSLTNLVEIDLLRSGPRMVAYLDDEYDYSILVSPSLARPRADFYAFTVRQPIPKFRLPLTPDDELPVVDVNMILHELYDRAGYDLRINYRNAPVPPFGQEDAAWADALLRQQGLR